MLGNRVRSNEPATIRNARHAHGKPPNALRQSGVYPRVSSTQIAASNAWADDEDDQVTRIRRPQAQATVQRSVNPPLMPNVIRQPAWQVSLLLKGDELTRLWARNATALTGRLFVWSDQQNAWMLVQGVPTYRAPVAQAELPRFSDADPATPMGHLQSLDHPAHTSRATGNPPQVVPVDLTAHARPLSQSFLSRHSWQVLAGLVGFVVGTATVGLVRAHSSVPSPRATPTDAVQPRSVQLPSRQAGDKSGDILPVSALPLVSPPSIKATGATRQPKSPIATSSIAASPAAISPFDVSRARRALEAAAGQARHCSSSEVSGAVLVTFEPTGIVSNVRLSALAGDTSQARCVVNSFYSVQVPSFAGSRITAKKSF